MIRAEEIKKRGTSHAEDEFVFRFNRRRAKSIGHRFARLIEIAVKTAPKAYWQIVERKTPNLKLMEG